MKMISREEFIQTMLRQMQILNNDLAITTHIEDFLECYELTIFHLLNGGIDGEYHTKEKIDIKEDLKIKIAKGISLERKYEPEKVQAYGALKGTVIPEHCNVRAKVTSNYVDKVNEYIKMTDLDVTAEFNKYDFTFEETKVIQCVDCLEWIYVHCSQVSGHVL